MLFAVLALGLVRPSHCQQLVHETLFSTLYGSRGTDDADVVAVDNEGNTYLGCHSTSANLPGSDRFPYALSGGMDAFVIKLNHTGTEVFYITQLGGAKWEAVQGIVVDDSGFVYAVGTTYSSGFPVTSQGFQSRFGGKSDAFVVKLDPKGNVVWSTLLGGRRDEDGRSIVLGERGKVHVVGRTASNNFSTTESALQPKLAGDVDAFVTTLDQDGRLISSTYLGGSGNDVGFDIEVGPAGRLYVAGTTGSQDFPVKNALQSENGGQDDAFLAVLDERTSEMEFSSYLGGAGAERLYSIALDASGGVFMMGFTDSPNFIITEGAFQAEVGGGRDAFVTRIDLRKREWKYSTYLGGEGNDSPRNLLVTPEGAAVVVGFTESNWFPTSTATGSGISGEADAFVAVLDPSGASLSYSHLFGGNGDDFFEGIALGPDGSFTLSGGSSSMDFPLVSPLQKVFQGGRFDILVSRIFLK